MQIELIQPLNAAPSHFKDWLEAGNQSVHHICVLSADMAEARNICKRANAKIILEATTGGAEKEVFYADTGGSDGTMIEVLETSPETETVFEITKRASVEWDGSDALRGF